MDLILVAMFGGIYLGYRSFLNTVLGTAFLLLPIVGILSISSVAIVFNIVSIILLCYHIIRLRISSPHLMIQSTSSGINKKVKYLSIIFFIYCAVSLLFSPLDPDTLHKSYFDLLKVVILCILGSYAIRVVRLYRISNEAILSYLPLTIFLSFILVVTEYLTGFTLTKLLYDRNISYFFIFFNKGICSISVIIWPVIAYYTIKKGSLGIFLLLCGNISIILMSKFLGTSYIASVSMILTSILFLGLMFIKRYKKIFTIFGIMWVLSVFPIVFSNPIHTSTIKGIVTKLKISIGHRVCVWEYTMNRYKEHKLLGLGFDTSLHFDKIYGDTCNMSMVDEDLPALSLHPHNLSIQILLELGVIGFGIFLLLLLAFAASIFQDDQRIQSTITSLDLQNKNILESSMIAAMFGFIFLPLQSFGIWQTWLITLGLLVIMMFVMLKNTISN